MLFLYSPSVLARLLITNVLPKLAYPFCIESNLQETSRNTRAKDSITKLVSLEAVEAVASFDFKHPSDARTNAAPPKKDTSLYKNLSNISEKTKEEPGDDGKSSQQGMSSLQLRQIDKVR
jgi:hypothetical protein